MFLGLDYGTSEVKALLMNTAGQIIATQGAPLTVTASNVVGARSSGLVGCDNCCAGGVARSSAE